MLPVTGATYIMTLRTFAFTRASFITVVTLSTRRFVSTLQVYKKEKNKKQGHVLKKRDTREERVGVKKRKEE
jgi:hypothetical protein